jgi:LPPG:FO 2-phospho-L-lactate transferase
VNVVVLAGGVGGAKLAHGVALLAPAAQLTVVVNTGDDFEHLGLSISPDLDTVLYTLAGLANPDTGWGVAGDSFEALGVLGRLGAPTWFALGDRDLGLHVERTRRRRAGERLTDVTRSLTVRLDVTATLLPMTDDPVATKVATAAGELDFQDYFVRLRCEPAVSGFRFAGSETARPSPEVLTALAAADLVLLGPSNPFVSIDPILGLPGVRERVASRPAAAVSPIIGGAAIKGPAAKMLGELGLDVSALAVARRYAGLIGGFVVDRQDAALAPAIEAIGLRPLVTDTVMRSEDDRRRLAAETLSFAADLKPAKDQARSAGLPDR